MQRRIFSLAEGVRCPRSSSDPGDVLATADALRALEFNEVTPQLLLGRHMSGDWGDLPARERRKNELRALTEDGHVISRFRLSDGEIVLVTTNLNEAGTLISQPGDDKHLGCLPRRGASPATRWNHPASRITWCASGRCEAVR